MAQMTQEQIVEALEARGIRVFLREGTTPEYPWYILVELDGELVGEIED